MLPWESSGGSPKRGRRWRDQIPKQASLDEPDNAASQGGPLDVPSEAADQGGTLEKEGIGQRIVQDKLQTSVTQDTQRSAGKQPPVDRQVDGTRGPQAQDQLISPQYPGKANAAAPTVHSSAPPPEPTALHPGIPHGIQSIPPQANIPPQVGTQQYTPQSYHPQYPPAPFASPASQHPPQSLSYQLQYQSTPTGSQTPQPSFQISHPSPHLPQQLSSVERLEMTKLKTESELQQNRLMEYQVATEHQEQQKMRLEEEVKGLMKRVRDIEEVRQKKELDAASKVSELEGKVRNQLCALHVKECTLT